MICPNCESYGYYFKNNHDAQVGNITPCAKCNETGFIEDDGIFLDLLGRK